MSLKSEFWVYLLEIAKAGGLMSPVSMTTTELGNLVGVSQQTASRRMVYLEEHVYIKRESVDGNRIQEVTITERGELELFNIFKELKRIFKKYSEEIMLRGRVSEGLGEGRYYVKKYKEYFHRNLDMVPFSGTLNIKLLGERDIMFRAQIEVEGGIHLEGFSDETRSFGDVWAFQVNVGRGEPGSKMLPAYILKIVRTHYEQNTVELISSHNLRKELGLENEDLVRIIYKPLKRKN